METFRFFASPLKNEFVDILSKTKKELLISSPFVNLEGVKILSNSIRKRANVNISLVTNLTTNNIINGVTQPTALLELYKKFNQIKVSSLGRLHAKVYLIDDKVGIITSANLTKGGLVSNFEYGVLINDERIVSTIKEDMLKYYSLGNIFDESLLKKISEESDQLCSIHSKTQNSIKGTKLAKLLKKSVNSLSFELLKNRIKEGKTINSIFSDTILYLLKKKGPLSTKEIHPLIQTIHSDICDDSMDRVIDGQHFGKKWKHSVRGAQVFLDRRGLAYLKNGKWHLGGER